MKNKTYASHKNALMQSKVYTLMSALSSTCHMLCVELQPASSQSGPERCIACQAITGSGRGRSKRHAISLRILPSSVRLSACAASLSRAAT